MSGTDQKDNSTQKDQTPENNEPDLKEHSDSKLKHDVEKGGKEKNTLSIEQVQNFANTSKVNDNEIKVNNINTGLPNKSESRLHLKESPRVQNYSR